MKELRNHDSTKNFEFDKLQDLQIPPVEGAQGLSAILVKATKPTFATPRTGDYDTYVSSLEEDQCAIFDSHLLYLVSSKTGGVAQQLASIELLEHNSAKRAFFELIERYTQCKDGGAATLRMLQAMRWRDHPSPDRLYVAVRTAAAYR